MKIAAIFLVLAVSTFANLLQNGGFETNTCQSDHWCQVGEGFFLGDNSWDEISPNGVDVILGATSSGYVCDTGRYCIDMNALAPGVITQSFATIPGHQYSLTFALSANDDPSCGISTKTAEVQVNFPNSVGTPIQSYSVFTLWGTQTAWGHYTYPTFTAPSTTAIVYFIATNSGCGGVLLDTVSVVDTASDPRSVCMGASAADWTPYGQGYYCESSSVFIQCWGDPSNPQWAVQPCPLGTSCQCNSAFEECSNHGQVSPCQ